MVGMLKEREEVMVMVEEMEDWVVETVDKLMEVKVD